MTSQTGKSGKLVLLSAGGTGGHLFPAQALAEVLIARGYRIALATDHRVERYGGDFPAETVHQIASATVSGRSPIALASTGLSLARGLRQSSALLGQLKPEAVVGFGGYPSFPPLMAAAMRSIPTALHEQNAVLGRANRMLASRVSAVATSFETVKFAENLPADRLHLTGNPVRSMVLEAARHRYNRRLAGNPLDVLVFGGSQGARYFSQTVPPAIAGLPAELKQRVRIVQQCRAEDLDTVQSTYETIGVSAECAPFFTDLPARIAKSQLVIARAGASTVAEITVIGRPAILVPLPHSLDNDQLQNAMTLQQAGGAWCFHQSELDPNRLSDTIASLMAQPDRLATAAEASLSQGRPDAQERLADMVERLISGKSAND